MEAGEWMLVSLIKKDKIYSVTLPLAVNGTYWVCDTDNRGSCFTRF